MHIHLINLGNEITTIPNLKYDKEEIGVMKNTNKKRITIFHSNIYFKLLHNY